VCVLTYSAAADSGLSSNTISSTATSHDIFESIFHLAKLIKLTRAGGHGVARVIAAAANVIVHQGRRRAVIDVAA
jgi:hypothetical protein